MKIRPYEESDHFPVSEIHKKSFPRQGFSKDWIRSLFGGFHRTQIYVADFLGQIIRYIVWTVKSGFRKKAVLELEQIAVAKSCRGRGFGKSLIEESLELVKESLGKRGSRLKDILVSTRTDNAAQQLYRKVLEAEFVAVIPGLYSGDEVLLRC